MKILSISLILLISAMAPSGCSSSIGPGGNAEPANFDTQDGVVLSGYSFGTVDIGVVLSHMEESSQKDWWPFARVLRDKGYTVLSYDFRGYGESGGSRNIDVLDLDVQAAVNYLEEKDVSRVVLIGAGMGGAASVKAAANLITEGVIVLSAPPMVEGLDIRDDLEYVTEPKLFIAAEGDTNGFYARSVDLFLQTSPQLSEGHKVEGMSHGTDLLYDVSGPRVQGFIIDFLMRYVD